MNSQINDGGPAFPVIHNPQDPRPDQDGMSLRDWFAGQVIATSLDKGIANEVPRSRIVRDAYELADAMIEARKPKPTT